MKTFRYLFCLLAFCGALSPVRAADVEPEKAIERVGKTSTIVGVAEEVRFQGGQIYVNFGGKYPNNAFVAVAEPASAKEFDVVKLRALEGKRVKVSGKVEMYQNKPAIILTRRGQLALAEATK